MADFLIDKEVALGDEGDYRLCFQYGEYKYDDGESELGYRFIWRKPNGNLQAARGQTRIPSIADILELIAMAYRDGWC